MHIASVVGKGLSQCPPFAHLASSLEAILGRTIDWSEVSTHVFLGLLFNLV